MKLAIMCRNLALGLLVFVANSAVARGDTPLDTATTGDGSMTISSHRDTPDNPPTSLASDEPSEGPPTPSVHHEVPDDAPVPKSVVLRGRTSSPARVWIRDGYESIQVNVDAQGNNIDEDAANEPSIAVDPTNPSRMAIGWRQFDTIESNFRQAGWAYTHNGGQTWTFPGVLEPGQFRSDPVLGADADGNFYFYSLSTLSSAELFKSTDGGVTWTGPVLGYGGDKEWMTIDQTNRIGRGNIYGIWNVQFSCCPPNDFTWSTNSGLSFMPPIAIPKPSMKWGTLAVGPEGELYAAGSTLDPDTHLVAKSINAQIPVQTPYFDFVKTVYLGGVTTSGGVNPAGLLGQVWIDVDHSNGPTRGNVYILGSVDPPGSDPLDVHFVRSTDGGLTWSDPVRVNDDPMGNGAWQWFGTMSVAPNGRIDVIWNDTREDVLAWYSELYYSSSSDAGITWSENVPLSPPFKQSLGYPQQNKLGDYYDMVSDNFGVSVAYAATFNGEEDIYFLRIGDFDCNNNNIPDHEDLVQGTSADCNANDVPDECDPDCNDNDLVDECEVRDGISPDCDGNLVPDECDPDFDGDGLVDGCDPDIDNDGVANEDESYDCNYTPQGLRVMADGRPMGDEDKSCVVDLPDWKIFRIRWLSYGGPGVLQHPTIIGCYDYDEDHDLDLRDFSEFITAFGQQ